jgi:predicted ATPase/class 3 adenylate cyclase
VLAFLFTDIEGSTRRWDAYSEAMRDAVRRHDALTREAIERHDGRVFKALGDAFCAAFPDVSKALDAAVSIQRALASDDFSAVGGLRVRIAIAAGEADLRDNDYFGTPVNRVARLLGAGNGGQILLSGEVADELAKRGPEGTALRQLGTVTLRDLKEPVLVYQAVADGLVSDFRPLRTLERPPNNLPVQASSFIGRHGDVLRLQDVLEHHALVTVGGAGGMGKTRLALEAAAAVLNERKDGTWFVDLAIIADERLVVSAILSAIGAEHVADASPVETLIGYLQQRETLLVLDNCEHVIGEVARIVSAILQRCPHVSVLATSRERLDVAGETFYQLDTLDLPTAVALFNERAAAARANFSPERDAPEVAEICRRLDGIALGIELAAAAIRTMPARTLLEHFDLRLLGGGRDRQPRQQTMNALIEWSYETLDTRQSDMLRRCAPCMGGFTLESAIAVAGGRDVEIIDLLSSLVDKSLVTADATRARYRLLEPIRQFAVAKLQERGDERGALTSHARAYAAFARDGFAEWEATPQPDWLDRMEADLGNLRAALSWCSANGRTAEGAALAADAAPVFLRLSLPAEGAQWCEQFLSAIPQASDELHARLYYVLSMLEQNLARFASSLTHAERAVAAYRNLPDEVRMLTRALSQLAHRYSVQRRYDEAQSAATEAMQAARTLGDTRLLADVLRRSAAAFSGRDDRMNEIYAESVALFRTLGNDDDTARALVWWGQSEAKRGNYARAASHLMKARDLAGQELAGSLLIDVVGCYLVVGDMQTAAALAREELAVNATFPHPIETPIALMHVAALSDAVEPLAAARLSGYAQAALRAAGWQLHAAESEILAALQRRLADRLSEEELTDALASGAALSRDGALTDAARLIHATG